MSRNASGIVSFYAVTLLGACAPVPDGPTKLPLPPLPDPVLQPPPAPRAPAAAPDYPAAAGGAGGQAVVDCTIGTDGFAHDCRVVSSDAPALGQAVLRWLTGPNPPHFDPAVRDGVAVAEPHRWAIYFQPKP